VQEAFSTSSMIFSTEEYDWIEWMIDVIHNREKKM